MPDARCKSDNNNLMGNPATLTASQSAQGVAKGLGVCTQLAGGHLDALVRSSAQAVMRGGVRSCLRLLLSRAPACSVPVSTTAVAPKSASCAKCAKCCYCQLLRGCSRAGVHRRVSGPSAEQDRQPAAPQTSTLRLALEPRRPCGDSLAAVSSGAALQYRHQASASRQTSSLVSGQPVATGKSARTLRRQLCCWRQTPPQWFSGTGAAATRLHHCLSAAASCPAWQAGSAAASLSTSCPPLATPAPASPCTAAGLSIRCGTLQGVWHPCR